MWSEQWSWSEGTPNLLTFSFPLGLIASLKLIWVLWITASPHILGPSSDLWMIGEECLKQFNLFVDNDLQLFTVNLQHHQSRHSCPRALIHTQHLVLPAGPFASAPPSFADLGKYFPPRDSNTSKMFQPRFTSGWRSEGGMAKVKGLYMWTTYFPSTSALIKR